MGKGFNNYMTKKFFHPSSKENIKRVWMAQQKTDFEKKKEEEMLNQYQKEQDMYENRALLGDEKAKLGLSFMYDAPPGLQKKEKEEAGEADVKFEWQRKYNAPREQYAKNDETILDQPFGIEVRNVRCIKCRKWGHVNTDRICPLFGKDLTAEPEQPKSSASSLLESMQEDGFTLKQTLLGKMTDPSASNEKILPSDEEDDPEVKFLKSLTLKQKKKLFKRLNKLQQGESTGKGEKKKKKKKKGHKHGKQKKKQDSSDDDSESPDEEVSKHKKSKKGNKKGQSTDSETSSEDEHIRKVRKNGGIGQKGRKSSEPRIKTEDERHGDHHRPRETQRERDQHRDSDHHRPREIKKEREERSERHSENGRGGDYYGNREVKRERDEYDHTERGHIGRYKDDKKLAVLKREKDSSRRSRSISAERYNRDIRNRDRNRSISRERYRSRSRSLDRNGQRSHGRKRSDSSSDDRAAKSIRRDEKQSSAKNGRDSDKKRHNRSDDTSSEESDGSDEGQQRSDRKDQSSRRHKDDSRNGKYRGSKEKSSDSRRERYMSEEDGYYKKHNRSSSPVRQKEKRRRHSSSSSS